jgi:hypothetical protein
MKRVAFVVGVLALGFAASTPARADFAVVKFDAGYCTRQSREAVAARPRAGVNLARIVRRAGVAAEQVA